MGARWSSLALHIDSHDMSQHFQPLLHSIACNKILPELRNFEKQLSIAKIFSGGESALLILRAQQDIHKFYECLEVADGVKRHHASQLSSDDLYWLNIEKRPWLHLQPPIETLPLDVWERIVCELKGDIPALRALSRVSRRFWALCLQKLWRSPRQLDTVERQMKFLLGGCLRPLAAIAVWDLDIVWYPGNVNGRLILEILKQCKGLCSLKIHLRHYKGKVAIEQGPSDAECDVLASMIQIISRVWEFEFRNDYYMNTTMDASQYSKFLKTCEQDITRIFRLELLGYGHQSLLDTILTARKRKLRHLRIDAELDMVEDGLRSLACHNHRGFYEASGYWVTHFQGLVTPRMKYDVVDLKRFQRHVAFPTIFCIKGVQNYDEIRDDERYGKLGDDSWFISALKIWGMPRVLHIGTEYSVTMGALRTLGSDSFWHLHSLELLNLEASCDPQPHMVALDELVSAIVGQHSQRLRHLSLDRRFSVGAQTLNACSKAPGLSMLLVGLKMSRKTVKLVDGLLDVCPLLKDIPACVVRRSKRRKEWLARGCPESGESIFLDVVDLL